MRGLATAMLTKAQALVRFAESLGIERVRLLAAAGIAPGVLDRADGRVASRAIAALWGELGRRTGDADIGLRLAESEASARVFGVVGFRAMMSDSLGEGLLCFARYGRLVSEDVNARLVEAPDAVVYELLFPPAGPDVARAMADRALASSLLLGRRWTGQPLRPQLVQFRHERPRSVTGYERIFDCPVEYRQPVNAIHFDRAAVASPLHAAQPDVAAYLETLAHSAHADLPRGDVGAAVAEAVRAELQRGAPALPSLARRLGVSARTLQRRLLAGGVTYHGIVEQVRRDVAIHLVTSTALPIAVVRERVGYAEEKAFRRAFRRWTGASPIELRRR